MGGDGLDRVWRAAEALAGGDGGLKVRLGSARAELTAALRRPEQWPDGLLHQAKSIERLLRPDGAADPLDRLDLGLARQVAEDILALAADVAAFAEGRWTPKTDREPHSANGRTLAWTRTPPGCSPP